MKLRKSLVNILTVDANEGLCCKRDGIRHSPESWL